MKPSKSILDRSFVYIPSASTSVDQTWRRFGWRPIAEEGQTNESHAASSKASGETLSVQQ